MATSAASRVTPLSPTEPPRCARSPAVARSVMTPNTRAPGDVVTSVLRARSGSPGGSPVVTRLSSPSLKPCQNMSVQGGVRGPGVMCVGTSVTRSAGPTQSSSPVVTRSGQVFWRSRYNAVLCSKEYNANCNILVAVLCSKRCNTACSGSQHTTPGNNIYMAVVSRTRYNIC